MTVLGIRSGDEVTVIVYWNKEAVGEITSEAVSDQELATQVYTDDERTLILVHEALQMASSAVDFHLQKPSLRRLIRERIDELKAIDDRREGEEPPSPTIDDLPF